MEEEHGKPSIATGIILGGKYAIGHKIGEGGMGTVWEATHIEIGRKVAIKTLHKIERNYKPALDRFRLEAQMAGSIGHDNICEVTDIGTSEDGSPFLVMPLLQGCPLSNILMGHRPSDPARISNIARQTLSALQAAHDRGIVHRDLKPDNIFLTTFGEQTDVVKLLDFGICKLMDQDPVTSLTQSGTILGTPFYMPPEQAKGYRDLDHRVDIYSMGVIMYEALTGMRPFCGDSYNEIMFKIVEASVPRISTFSKKVSAELESVVLKAMARNRNDRFDSAMEMRRALDKATGRVSSASMELSPELPGSEPENDKPLLEPDEINTITETVAFETADVVTSRRSGRGGLIYAFLSAVILLLAGGVVYLIFGNEIGSGQTGAGDSSVASQPLPRQVDRKIDEPEPTVKQDAGAHIPDASTDPVEAIPKEAVPTEKKASSKKGKKGKRPPKKVKGRFGTSILSEYDD